MPSSSVGPRGLDVRDEAGKRRLDSPNDIVRIEIEAALARGIPVIPVLVGNAKMPSETDLPPSLSPLAYRHGIDIRPDPDFHHDMDRLNSALEELLRSARFAEAERTERGSGPAAAPGDVPTKDIDETSSQLESSGEPENPAVPDLTAEELQMVRDMLARLTTGGVNYEVNNLAPVARELHEASQGREALSLCQIVKDTTVSNVDRYKAVKLLGLAIRQRQSRPFLEIALNTLVDYGVLSSTLQTASLEAFMEAPASPKAKWERLFAALDLASETQLPSLIEKLGQVIPPSGRQATGARLIEFLHTMNNSGAVSQICYVLTQIGYRAGVPELISITEMSAPGKAAAISGVLVAWRVIEAAQAIRQAIENARYGTDYSVAYLMKNLYSLEGAVASGYLAEVLRDAVSSMQGTIVDALGDVNDSAFVEVVTELATNSLDEAVKKKAQAFMQKRGIVA